MKLTDILLETGKYAMIFGLAGMLLTGYTKNDSSTKQSSTSYRVETDQKNSEVIKDFQSIRDLDLFDAKDIHRLSSINRPKDEIIDYVNSAIDLEKRLDGFTISRYCQLDVPVDNIGKFNDTIRPNMVYVVPRSDSNDAFENEGSLKLYRELSDVYDTYPVVASSEDDVYGALDKIPDISLVVLGGHGSTTTLQLGSSEFYNRKLEDTRDKEFYIDSWSEDDYRKVDEHFIDTLDYELKEHTQNFTDNVVIFLNSCLNGNGGKTKDNLANFMMDYLTDKFPESTVYSSTGVFTSNDVNIRKKFPLNLQIVHYIEHNPFRAMDSFFINLTYSNREEDSYNVDFKTVTEPYEEVTTSK